jgi:hypothetical protein
MSLISCLITMLSKARSAAALLAHGMWCAMNHRHGCTVMVPVKAGPRRVR